MVFLNYILVYVYKSGIFVFEQNTTDNKGGIVS